MTYEIEIVEPRAKKLLQELANLNLIKFVQPRRRKPVAAEDAPPTREEILAGLADAAREINASIRGEIQLRSIYDVLDEMEAEEKLETAS
jgi:hypothetical protein